MRRAPRFDLPQPSTLSLMGRAILPPRPDLHPLPPPPPRHKPSPQEEGNGTPFNLRPSIGALQTKLPAFIFSY